jgi:Ca-activated chloride channel family protein
MSRLPAALAITLTATLLASCSKQGIEAAAPPTKVETSAAEPFVAPAPPQAEAADGAITVTGQRIAHRGLHSVMPVTVVGNDHFQGGPVNRDRFTTVEQNGFQAAAEAPVSTFSIDVDTASYAFTRASLNQGVLPQQAAVRTEEMVNYFPYDYASRAAPASRSAATSPSSPARGHRAASSSASASRAMPSNAPNGPAPTSSS